VTLQRLGLQPGALRFSPGRRRGLGSAVTLSDIAKLAHRATPRLVIDFIEGGAEDEATVAGNRAAFASVDLMPRMLGGVAPRDMSVHVLDTDLSIPIVLGPAGLARLAHPDGEVAAARAANKAGTAFTLSTGSSISIEEVAGAAPGRLWFQLYLWRDRDVVRDLLQRAERAGYRALVLTVDVPAMGQRERDMRNGMAIPPRFDGRTVRDVARHPKWLARVVRQPPVTFANLLDVPGRGVAASDLAHYTNVSLVNPGADWETLEWVRRQWRGPLAVKGILHPADAVEAVRRGADAIIVSNHGGRQLDGAIPSLEALPDIVDAVGSDTEVLFDGGIRRGTDVIKALSLGAKAVMIARPWMLGLAAGGEDGVAATLHILAGEVDRNLALVGCRRATDLTADYVVPRRVLSRTLQRLGGA
jgi:L-lactate dehydrogenase (cytochrome)